MVVTVVLVACHPSYRFYLVVVSVAVIDRHEMSYHGLGGNWYTPRSTSSTIYAWRRVGNARGAAMFPVDLGRSRSYRW